MAKPSPQLDLLRVPLVTASVKPGSVVATHVPKLPAGPDLLDAPWIWIQTQGKPTAVQFRKTFTLAALPSSAVVDVTAEVSYLLFVNGQLVSRGPANVGRDYDTDNDGEWLFDRRELAKYFHKGPNVVAVLVFPDRWVSSESVSGHPGLCLKATFHSKAASQIVATDETWKASVDPSISRAVPGTLEPLAGREMLQFNGPEERTGWTEPAFDDTKWESATVVPSAFGFPRLSQLPPLMEAPYPASKMETTTHGVSVSYDRVLSAYVGLTVKGSKGTVITVKPNEMPAALTSGNASRPFRWVLRDGEQTIQSPYIDSFSNLNIEFSNVTGPVQVGEVRALFSSLPVTYQGDFECSDPALTKLWHVGRWATQICMQTHHLDSPNHQEPICDPGDYLIESLVGYQTFGDGRLAKQDLQKYGQLLRSRKNHPFHTSYALLWLRMLVEYYNHTGDKALLQELAPTVYSLLDTWHGYVGQNGLISEAPNYMFMDWVELEGFNLHHPPAVIGQGYMSALYCAALDDEALIAKVLGNDPKALNAQEERGKVRLACRRELLSNGLFVDGRPFQSSVKPSDWLPADKEIATFSTQGNTLAVSCGLVDKDEAEFIMEKLMARPDLHCQPYFMHFVFDALDKAGLYDKYATTLMRRWKVIPETQSFREMWHDGDYSHAWGATPTYQLSSRVLGIQPLGVGYQTVRIAPHFCDLAWAKGTVPTPHGPITVSWVRGTGHSFHLRLGLPKGVQATFVDPFTGNESLLKGSVDMDSAG